ncbi:MAG: transcriptional regulator, partial [Gammaproteobacteria bacterium]
TRHHLLDRLQAQIDASSDPTLVALLAELAAYPGVDGHEPVAADHPGVMVPLQLRAHGQVLSFFSTLTVFGSPLEITLSELAVEAFFPADEETAEYLRRAC